MRRFRGCEADASIAVRELAADHPPTVALIQQVDAARPWDGIPEEPLEELLFVWAVHKLLARKL